MLLTPDRVFEAEFGKDVLSAEELAQSPMRNYFKGKTIFLTGATGFIGQLLLEKLLRCDVGHVYVLARAKKNKPPEERLNKLFEEQQFEKLRQYNADFRQHVSVIVGDLADLNLGLKDADQSLLEDTVEIVLHAAADVRFNERLSDLVLTNLRGTRELLKLAESFKKLQVFNYISTAYSNCSHGKHIREDFYEPPVDPDTIISYVERCRDQAVEFDNLAIFTERLIGDWPNTYTFSKSLSEALVHRYSGKFPLCVVRPSIVISTHHEPVPGWCNNLFGLNGAFIGFGLGVLRIAKANPRSGLNVVCADFTVNNILAATWTTQEEANKLRLSKATTDTEHQVAAAPPAKVYAAVSAPKQFSMEYLLKIFIPITTTYPTQKGIWSVCLNFTNCSFLFWYFSIFYHFLANVVFDIGLALVRHEMRLVPVFRKIHVFILALAYFMQNEWDFDTTNMCAIWDSMHPIDKRLFSCDTRKFDFKKWSLTFVQGLKYYGVHDPLNDAKSARFRYNCFKVAHVFVLIIYYLLQAGIFYMLAKPFGLVDFMQHKAISAMDYLQHSDVIQNGS